MSEHAISEPARTVPVACTVDVVVVGGSCTGVFAAVRAARLGKSVALIELHNQFGGVATARLVNVWHSLWSTDGQRQVIAGMTTEVTDRLLKRGACIQREKTNPSWQFCFNSAELACELDEIVREHAAIRPFLHARFVAAQRDGDRVTAVVIEDKSGRRAIRCNAVVDATGDADVCRRLGMPTRRHDLLQPPTMAAIIHGITSLRGPGGRKVAEIVFDPTNPRALKDGFLWSADLPGCPSETMVFGTRVHGVNCGDADQLTQAEMEGRAQVRTMVDLLREACPDLPVALTALPACIGIRETDHIDAVHQLTEHDLLHGVRYDDAIAQGTYRVDVHHQGGSGLTFRYLDGREVIVGGDGNRENTRWRDPVAEDPTFYQVPYRSLVPKGLTNVLAAGRHLDADVGSFGAVRVMVLCNQMGEAAGVAASLALDGDTTMADVPAATLRHTLEQGGSADIATPAATAPA